jgi:hypothetical protein
MPASNPTERQLIARAAAHQSWAATANRTARTAAARDAFLARFEDQVDPERDLIPEERAKRATNARRAYFLNLARESAKRRRDAAPQRRALAELAEATQLLALASAQEGTQDAPSSAAATDEALPERGVVR